MEPSILIVDDNPRNLQILGKFLKGNGYSIEFALNGELALEWMEQKDFDLVLLDVMMPGLTGFEVCERIKTNGKYKDIPVIFLTAQRDPESIVKGFSLGAIDYVTKPFNKEELMARVNTQIQIRNSQNLISRYLTELEEKNELITKSIQCAQNIQKSIVHQYDSLSGLFDDQFILYKPKDIVSGDFYWFHPSPEGIVISVMDCTGHGVPGAMMSMIGNTLLNEIVKSKKCIQPDQILDRLRRKIINILGQKNTADRISFDGMDGSIMLLNSEKGNLHFAGANSSIYLVRDEKLIRIPGDRMPVSFYTRMEEFKLKKEALRAGDMLYALTDGYIDQFGGARNKKFGRKAFEELVMQIHNKPAIQQKEILSGTLEKWMGDMFQVDDVTVLGIRISDNVN